MKFWRNLFRRKPQTALLRRTAPRTTREQTRAELERDIALASIEENHPVWQAVLMLVDDHAAAEKDGALSPNLSNEQRQYAAGAAATADYLAKMLRDARTLAAQRMAKAKQEE